MTERLPRLRLPARLRDSSWFAFGATTAALVLLASGGTAVLVQFGSGEGRDPSPAHRVPPVQAAPSTGGTTVTVDRLVGSFRTAVPADRQAAQQLSLADLLATHVPGAPQPPTPPTPPDPGAPLLPTPPPIPVDPGPQPTPPTIHPPVLPLPNPLPIPLPIPLPKLPTLPAIPLPLPHL